MDCSKAQSSNYRECQLFPPQLDLFVKDPDREEREEEVVEEGLPETPSNLFSPSVGIKFLYIMRPSAVAAKWKNMLSL